MRLHCQVFLYLQVLDMLTTLAGLRLGLREISPFFRQIMQVDAALGLWNLSIIRAVRPGL